MIKLGQIIIDLFLSFYNIEVLKTFDKIPKEIGRLLLVLLCIMEL